MSDRGPHSSHVIRSSDASSFDSICVNCGVTDTTWGWGSLVYECSSPGKPFATTQEYYDARKKASRLYTEGGG